jgi:hypothetical protein
VSKLGIKIIKMKSAKLLLPLGLCIGFGAGYWLQYILHKDELTRFKEVIEFNEFYRKRYPVFEAENLEVVGKMLKVLDDSTYTYSKDSVDALLNESLFAHSSSMRHLRYIYDIHKADSTFVKKPTDEKKVNP